MQKPESSENTAQQDRLPPLRVAEAWNRTATTPTELAAAMQPVTPAKTQPASMETVYASDACLLEKARTAANGAKFSRLYSGDWSGYESQSSADQALCNMLAFWTSKDAVRMDCLFRQSGLMREKWDEIHSSEGQTYGEMTINKAIAACRDVYTPAGEQIPPASIPLITFYVPPPISANEWSTARTTPDCIVEDYLFADVALKVAPGGTGKTTLELFEAVHIVLGHPLYSLKIRRPGPVVILTAEDSREIMVARLRRIAEALALTPAEIEQVQRQVRIADLCGDGVRLTEIFTEMVRPTAYVDALGERLADLGPVLVVIDPAVSFGVGESRVNDAEQGLVEAGRRLRKALNCCVRYIHHGGKEVYRQKILDQYAGRGGSAFADGARMVHVLQPLNARDWRTATGTDLWPGENGLILARPKMSYCQPQSDVLLRRRGYLFEHIDPVTADPMAALRQDAGRLLAIMPTLSYPTQNMLVAADTGLSRDRTREVVRYLIDAGQMEYRKNPRRGGAQQYLHVIDTTAGPHTFRAPNELSTGERNPESDPSCAAAYREEKARAPTRGLSPCDPKVSGKHTRAPTAQLAHLESDSRNITPHVFEVGTLADGVGTFAANPELETAVTPVARDADQPGSLINDAIHQASVLGISPRELLDGS